MTARRDKAFIDKTLRPERVNDYETAGLII
jgi:hypothetical protein